MGRLWARRGSSGFGRREMHMANVASSVIAFGAATASGSLSGRSRVGSLIRSDACCQPKRVSQGVRTSGSRCGKTPQIVTDSFTYFHCTTRQPYRRSLVTALESRAGYACKRDCTIRSEPAFDVLSCHIRAEACISCVSRQPPRSLHRWTCVCAVANMVFLSSQDHR